MVYYGNFGEFQRRRWALVRNRKFEAPKHRTKIVLTSTCVKSMRLNCIYLEPMTRARECSVADFTVIGVSPPCFPLDLRGGCFPLDLRGGGADAASFISKSCWTGLILRVERLGSVATSELVPGASTCISSSPPGSVDSAAACDVPSGGGDSTCIASPTSGDGALETGSMDLGCCALPTSGEGGCGGANIDAMGQSWGTDDSTTEKDAR